MVDIKRWVDDVSIDNSDTASSTTSEITRDDMIIYNCIHDYYDDGLDADHHQYSRRSTNQIVLKLRKVKRCPLCKEPGHYSKTCLKKISPPPPFIHCRKRMVLNIEDKRIIPRSFVES